MLLIDCKNIGKKLSEKLTAVGIKSIDDLKKIGSVEAYKKMQACEPKKNLPVCYYLYSLEGALRNQHWNNLSDRVKKDLKKKVKL